MKIVLSNDDGYQAPGINILAEVLGEMAEVITIAPDRDRSGAANSLTLDRPVSVKEVRKNCYYVNGTPTDCVHLAVTGFLPELPDMVISGINNGPNLGDDVLYSGTVAAAIEGRVCGFPAIAVSLSRDATYYDTAAFVTKDLVRRVMSSPLPAKTILNVNVPNLPLSELGEYEITRLGTRHLAQSPLKQLDPRGNDVYWIGLPGLAQDSGPGTDFQAVKLGNISITPIELEWTNYNAFDEVASWVSELNESLKSKD